MMGAEVLGISGSPIKNSNTDRLLQAMLAETGCKTEFIKLGDINVRPCMGCKRCVPDNVCKVEDDFPALAMEIINYEHMELIGQITVPGNLHCLSCGHGDDCEQSAVPLMYGEDARTADHGYSRVEEMDETWNLSRKIGRRMGERLNG